MGGSGRLSPSSGSGSTLPPGGGTPDPNDRKYRDQLLRRQENVGLHADRLTDRSTALGQQLSAITGNTPEDIERRQHIADRQERIGDRVERLTNKDERISERLKTGDYGPERQRMAGEAMQPDQKLTGQDKIKTFRMLSGTDRSGDNQGFWEGMRGIAEDVKQRGKPYSRDEFESKLASYLHR